MTIELNALLLLTILPTLDNFVKVMLIDHSKMAFGETLSNSFPIDISSRLKNFLAESITLTNASYLNQIQPLEHPLDLFLFTDGSLLLECILSFRASLVLFNS